MTPSAPVKPTIQIAVVEFRSSGRVVIRGVARGVPEGAAVVTWSRVGTQASYRQGRSVSVGEDGSFAWSRQVRPDSNLRIYVTWDNVRSNVVRIRGNSAT